MNRKPWWSVTVAAVMAVSGCVVYEPVVVSPQSTVQQRFDRAWTAASGAMYDQGVAITVQDRAAGVIRGERGGITITATLQAMADGSVQVKFNQSGASSSDPGLINRISESYDRRMGL
ncbi:MAG TPA: hypothetical protein VFF44_03385 [Casimicrobiaceae bacterium]|nr:hypothetical protein [Casimicrobiaceae bacterium]